MGCFSFFIPSENGVPVLSLSDQKDIALEVTVSNLNGDDAYEASMVATFPPSLTYSAFRPEANVSFVLHVHIFTHTRSCFWL